MCSDKMLLPVAPTYETSQKRAKILPGSWRLSPGPHLTRWSERPQGLAGPHLHCCATIPGGLPMTGRALNQCSWCWTAVAGTLLAELDVSNSAEAGHQGRNKVGRLKMKEAMFLTLDRCWPGTDGVHDNADGLLASSLPLCI